MMQADFIEYIRKKTRYYCTITIIVLCVFGLLSVGFTPLAKKESLKQVLRQTSITYLGPSLLAGVFLVLSFRRLSFVEAVMPVFFISHVVTLILINKVDILAEVTDNMRQIQNLMFYVAYFFSQLYLSASFLQNLIIRCFLLMFGTYVLVSNRH